MANRKIERPPQESASEFQQSALLEIVADAQLSHTEDGNAHIKVSVKGRSELHRAPSKGLEDFLRHKYFLLTGTAPSKRAIETVQNTIAARARYAGSEEKVHLRIATSEGELCIDLGNRQRDVVRITEEGWFVCRKLQVEFTRTASMRALPIPQAGGSIESLSRYMRFQSEDDLILLITWLLAAYRSKGPYPVLAICGEKDAGKTTATRLIRSLVDPNKVAISDLPRNGEELIFCAEQQHVLAFDNLAPVKPNLSDALCRLSTGGGYRTRKLYSDKDEVTFDAMRPIILNGIGNLVTRPDLVDRCIFLHLEPILDDERISEDEYWSEFEKEKPLILGALFNGLVAGLKNLPDLEPQPLLRMADAMRWAIACETAYWDPGTVAAAYRRNQTQALEELAEADPLISFFESLMEFRPEWRGTSTQLCEALSQMAAKKGLSHTGLPSSPIALSQQLSILSPVLRELGYSVERQRSTDRSRMRLLVISKDDT